MTELKISFRQAYDTSHRTTTKETTHNLDESPTFSEVIDTIKLFFVDSMSLPSEELSEYFIESEIDKILQDIDGIEPKESNSDIPQRITKHGDDMSIDIFKKSIESNEDFAKYVFDMYCADMRGE